MYRRPLTNSSVDRVPFLSTSNDRNRFLTLVVFESSGHYAPAEELRARIREEAVFVQKDRLVLRLQAKGHVITVDEHIVVCITRHE